MIRIIVAMALAMLVLAITIKITEIDVSNLFNYNPSEAVIGIENDKGNIHTG